MVTYFSLLRRVVKLFILHNFLVEELLVPSCDVGRVQNISLNRYLLYASKVVQLFVLFCNGHGVSQGMVIYQLRPFCELIKSVGLRNKGPVGDWSLELLLFLLLVLGKNASWMFDCDTWRSFLLRVINLLPRTLDLCLAEIKLNDMWKQWTLRNISK